MSGITAPERRQARPEHQPPQLSSIDAQQDWYTHDQRTGAVTILKATWQAIDFRPDTEPRAYHLLSETARMALALTSACCKVGVGKVD